MRPSPPLLKAALEEIRHLSGLPEEILHEIGSAAQFRRYDTGQVIFLEGEPADHIFVLVSGWVKATRMSRAGREQSMQVLHPIELFGDVAVFAQQPYPATVTALEPVEVFSLPAPLLLRSISRHPVLALAMAQRMSERVLYYVGLVEDLSLRSVEARLASSLLRDAQERDGGWFVPRRSWATYDEMAGRLGTVRDVLSRAFKNLEAEGLLRVGKQDIALLDIHGLVERSNS